MSQSKSNASGVLSMVLGCIALITSCFFGGVVGLIALPLGILGCASNRNKAYGVTGIVTSLVSIVVSVFVLIFALNNSSSPVLSNSPINSNSQKHENANEKDLSSSSNNAAFHLDNDNFSAKYKRSELTKDSLGNSVLIVYYDFTMKNSNYDMIGLNINLRAFQNGDECELSYYMESGLASDDMLSTLRPGDTVEAHEAFQLLDLSDVELRVRDLQMLDSEPVYQIISLSNASNR